MAKKSSVAVMPRRDGRWAVKRDGAKRASSLHETQRAAEAAGRATAERETTEWLIKGRGGEIRRRDSFGNDPRNRPG